MLSSVQIGSPQRRNYLISASSLYSATSRIEKNEARIASRRRLRAQGPPAPQELLSGEWLQWLLATLIPVLRLTSGETYTFLRRMRPFGKVGVSLVSLLLLATPTMACLVPAAAMTAAEHDCCKRMAYQCGNKGMPQSHPCCQTTTVPSHLAAIKSSSDVSSQHPTLFVASPINPGPTISTVPESGSSPLAADIHSPPISPPVAISVLRI